MDKYGVAFIFFGVISVYLCWFFISTNKVKTIIFKLSKKEKLKRGLDEWKKIAEKKGDELIEAIDENDFLRDFSAFEISVVESTHLMIETRRLKKNGRRFNEEEVGREEVRAEEGRAERGSEGIEQGATGSSGGSSGDGKGIQ